MMLAETIERRQIQRADVIAGGRVRIRSRIEQHVHELKVVALGRPVKRRETVALRRAHVHPLLQQRANGLDIFLFTASISRVSVSCARGDARQATHNARAINPCARDIGPPPAALTGWINGLSTTFRPAQLRELRGSHASSQFYPL